MVKYRVSKYVGIKNIDDNYDTIPLKYAHGYFILFDETEDSEYLINATVKYYLDKFSIYKTEEEVLHEVKEDVQSDSEEIKKTCSRFFDFLCKVKILVPDNEPECGIVNEPLYKEGDTIDQLRIVKVLSNRSYTDVYSATKITDGCVYVIKLLNRNKTISGGRYQKELAEMEQEYKMLQKTVNVPTINKAYGFIMSMDGNPYIILEYIEGKSLTRYLAEEAGSLTFPDCLHIIKSIINAFACMHQNNIIHGDIHSSNILVTPEKEVRIIDLGLSRNVEIEENEIVKAGGVYSYMPPERINTASFKKFSKDPDLFSDVYQVGLLIYLVLYNTLPFEGFTWEDLAKSIKEENEAYRADSFINYPVPSELVDIIKNCLDKEPLKRYANASEISAALKKRSFAGKEFVLC